MDLREHEAARREWERQANRRLQVEAEGRRAEAERQELRRLSAGGKTSRQRQAAAYLGYLDVVMHGRWLPNMEEAAGRGTQLDRGQALKAASKAAHDAVVDPLRPLVDQAQAELETAAAERDAIVRQGHL